MENSMTPLRAQPSSGRSSQDGGSSSAAIVDLDACRRTRSSRQLERILFALNEFSLPDLRALVRDLERAENPNACEGLSI